MVTYAVFVFLLPPDGIENSLRGVSFNPPVLVAANR